MIHIEGGGPYFKSTEKGSGRAHWEGMLNRTNMVTGASFYSLFFILMVKFDFFEPTKILKNLFS